MQIHSPLPMLLEFKKVISGLCLIVFFMMTNYASFAQSRALSGKVVADDNAPLPGVNVVVKGTSSGTITDVEGNYTLSVPESADSLVFSFMGYKPKAMKIGSQSKLNVTLVSDVSELSEVLVLGSRNANRTKLETPVPVDVISIQDVMGDLPQIDLGQMLKAIAPSFNAFRSQGGDLNSHVDAAQLRNLAPNQTLVLVNGKRRHASALLLTSTQVGSPSTTVDLMTIPASSIDRIEILRDGAAAQYGSDAIAGVINIVLKQSTNQLSGTFTGGAYTNTGGGSDYIIPGDADGQNYQLTANYGFDIGQKGGYLNLSGEITQRNGTVRNYLPESDPAVGDYTVYDGTYLNNQRTDKFGNPIITNPELLNALATGNEAAASSLTTQAGLMAARGLTMKDVAAYWGLPAIDLGSVFYNAGIPLSNGAEIYAFGGLNYKSVKGYSCYYRRPAQTDRWNYLLYPNGFRPQMTTNQSDASTTVGIKGKAGTFDLDFSNSFGQNSIRIGMVNTLNASLGANSPVDMYLGTHTFTENTANLDLSKFNKNILSGLNIAFGAEMRIEHYQIERGQEESYIAGEEGFVTAPSDNYSMVGPDGKPLENGAAEPIVDANGDPVVLTNKGDKYLVKDYAANCQCFRGFSPKNERNEFRTVMAAYGDVELEITDKFMVEGAFRGENYSDFGGVLTGKFATRYSLTDRFALRASASTGFRAPSLQEINYTHTYTYFLPDGTPVDGTLYPNNSTAAKVLGIPELKQEKSTSYSAGFTAELVNGLSITVDAYQIFVKDRIFQTGNFVAGEVGRGFDEVLGNPNAEASFFVNGADVKTRGIDMVASYNMTVGAGTLRFTLSGNINKNQYTATKVPQLNTSMSAEDLRAKYVSRSAQGQFEYGNPRQKIIFSADYKLGRFSLMLRPIYYGPVEYIAGESETPDDGLSFWDQDMSAQTTLDVSIGYEISKNIKLFAGGDNVFDAYPDALRPEIRYNTSLYDDEQQGFNGAYYYGRLQFNF